jgi:hypothetical protein
MSRVSVGLALVAVLVLTTFVAGPASSQPPAAGGDPTLVGPFMTVVKKSNPLNSIDLEKVHIRKLVDRTFLVGTGADTPDNWQKGKTVWVALDDVSEMTVFSTLDELRKAGTLHDSPKADNPPKKEGQ